MSDIPVLTKPHPWIALRRQQGPVKVREQHHDSLNGRIALHITRGVSTMWCAYCFAGLALLGFPTGNGTTIHEYIAWFSQTFLQLTLLAVIMVGQDVAGKAADKRAESTYTDAEAILHEIARLTTLVEELPKTAN